MPDVSAAGVYVRLRTHYDGLSKGERRVADYLLQNTAQLDFLSITELADAAMASESTIVRLVRKLGYAGFVAFKKALLAEIVAPAPSGPVGGRTRLGADDPVSAARTLIEVMTTALADTGHALTGEAFMRAVALVAAAERLELFANHQSGHIATTSIYRFLTLGFQANARTEPLSQAHYAGFLGPRDLVLVLSHGGLAANLIDACVAARRQGAAVVAITSQPRSPIATAADVHLLVPLPTATLGDEAGVIRIAQIAMLECLAVAAASRRLQGGDAT